MFRWCDARPCITRERRSRGLSPSALSSRGDRMALRSSGFDAILVVVRKIGPRNQRSCARLRALSLTLPCRDQAAAPRHPHRCAPSRSSSQRARCLPSRATLSRDPCRLGSLLRATRAPLVVRSALRCAVRAFPSPACASVEWAWPASRSGFAPRACSRRSCRPRSFDRDRRLRCRSGGHPRSIAVEARSRARYAWA